MRARRVEHPDLITDPDDQQRLTLDLDRDGIAGFP